MSTTLKCPIKHNGSRDYTVLEQEVFKLKEEFKGKYREPIKFLSGYVMKCNTCGQLFTVDANMNLVTLDYIEE